MGHSTVYPNIQGEQPPSPRGTSTQKVGPMSRDPVLSHHPHNGPRCEARALTHTHPAHCPASRVPFLPAPPWPLTCPPPSPPLPRPLLRPQVGPTPATPATPPARKCPAPDPASLTLCSHAGSASPAPRRGDPPPSPTAAGPPRTWPGPPRPLPAGPAPGPAPPAWASPSARTRRTRSRSSPSSTVCPTKSVWSRPAAPPKEPGPARKSNADCSSDMAATPQRAPERGARVQLRPGPLSNRQPRAAPSSAPTP